MRDVPWLEVWRRTARRALARLAVCVLVAGGLGPLACADGEAPRPGTPEPEPPRGVELIGVSGRRLADGDVYRVPLDYADATIAPGESRREAFVIVNATAEDALVEHLGLASRDGSAGEWALLAPTRARDVPLAVDGLRLGPGARLDFDVEVTPAIEGERETALELDVRTEGRREVRVVTLGARCARAPP